MNGWRRLARAAFLIVVPLCSRERQEALHANKCVYVLLLSCLRTHRGRAASIREQRWRPAAAQATKCKNTLPGSGVEDFASKALCFARLPVHLLSPELPALLSLHHCPPAPGSKGAMAPQSAQDTGASGLFNRSVSVPAGAEAINAASAAAPARATGCGGTNASPLPTVLTDVFPEWSTGKLQMDAWLQLKTQSQEVFAELTQISKRGRRQLATASKRKEGEIINMTSYILRCIRKAVWEPDSCTTKSRQHGLGSSGGAPVSPPAATCLTTATVGHQSFCCPSICAGWLQCACSAQRTSGTNPAKPTASCSAGLPGWCLSSCSQTRANRKLLKTGSSAKTGSDLVQAQKASIMSSSGELKSPGRLAVG